MFADYSEKLAKLIVQYSVNIQPDDLVMIRAPINAEELIREVYREVIQAGGNVIRLSLTFNGQAELFYKYASEKQIKYVDQLNLNLMKRINKSIDILSNYNTKALTNVPPEKKMMAAEAQKEISKTFFDRAAKKELLWNVSPYPCDAFAQEANMGRLEYSEFVYHALNLHKDDPVEYWKRLETQQEKIIELLNKGSEFQIIGKDTNLTLGIKNRKWLNGAGHENLPDGEVLTAPIEDSVNGTIRFTYPGLFQGQEIEDVQLTFKEGKVTEGIARKGQTFLQKLLEIPNADRLGELGIGTNNSIQRFTKNILFDEKMGGTIHLALGAGYPESGSKNQSSIHWDLLKDMKDSNAKLLLDGEVIYQEGKWLIG
jgi:aminopeptidase